MSAINISDLYGRLKKNEIRVVHVKYEHDELSGTLSKVKLFPTERSRLLLRKQYIQKKEENHPETRWFALSYVWGDPTPSKEFTLNGSKTLIHLNLYQALRNMCLNNSRENLETHPLWTDYICINQADMQEKARHIHSMDQIYQNAYCVYSYIGESNEYTQGAVDFLSRLHPIIQEGIDDWTKQCVSNGEALWVGNAPFIRDNMPPSEQKLGIAKEIRQIVLNKGFDRIWILQENVLARHQIFLRGSISIPTELVYEYCQHAFWRLYVCMAFYDVLPMDKFTEEMFPNPWPYMHSWCNPDETSADKARWPEPRPLMKRFLSRLLSSNLLMATKYAKRIRGADFIWYSEDPSNPIYHLLEMMMYFTINMECTMPEDRCLSLIGLFKWGARRIINRSSHLFEKPPKSLDPKTIFILFATTMLQSRNGMIVLSWALYSSHQIDYDLPSWCPNFHHMAQSLIGNIYYDFTHSLVCSEIGETIGDLPVLSYHEAEHALTCYGVRVDNIKTCMRTTWKQAGGEEIGSIGTVYEMAVSEVRIRAAMTFLKEVWELFQEAVHLSPRVKESYRTKIQDCSMAEAGMSFLTSVLRLESVLKLNQERKQVEGMDIRLVFAYLEKLITLSTEHGIEIRKVLAEEYAKAESILGNLTLLENQHFFVTENGYFGSGTTEVKPGDTLVMLAGARYPFILRPVQKSGDTERWHLMAEAHVSELSHYGVYINELDPPVFWPTSFRVSKMSQEDEEEQNTGENQGAVGAKEGQSEEKDDYTPEWEFAKGWLRWTANEVFETGQITIEDYTFPVTAFEGKHENFTLI